MFRNTDNVNLKLDDEKTEKAGEAIYEVTMIGEPLQFDLGMVSYQANKHYWSDLGSTPLGIGKDTYFYAYLMHDSGYQQRGLYVYSLKSGLFLFHPMARSEIDNLFMEMIIQEGELRGKPTKAILLAPLMWSMIRLFGGSHWKRKGKKK